MIIQNKKYTDDGIEFFCGGVKFIVVNDNAVSMGCTYDISFEAEGQSKTYDLHMDWESARDFCVEAGWISEDVETWDVDDEIWNRYFRSMVCHVMEEDEGFHEWLEARVSDAEYEAAA